MSDIYSNNSKNNDSATVCQTCGADRWPGTDACPMCGNPYGAKTNVGSGTGNGGYQKKKFEPETQQTYLSPYERGVYDKDPDANKKKNYGERVVPWSLILKIVIGVVVVVCIVIIGMRVVGGLVDERVEEETQKEQVYDHLSDERRDPSKD